MTARERFGVVVREQVGTRLRRVRELRNLSQEEMGWIAGVTQGSISNYENGRNEIPLSVLIAICGALGIRPTELVPALEESALQGATMHA